MKSDALKAWLKKKKTWGFIQNEFLGMVALLLGIVLLFLTFWFTYAVIWGSWAGVSAASELIFNKRLSFLPHKVLLLGSGIFMILLFIQHFRTNPSYWGDYSRRDYSSPDALKWQVGLDYYTGIGSLLMYPGASSKMIVDILLTGPRLATGAYGLLRQGYQIRSIDVACAELLAFLLSKVHVVPYDELKAAGWEPWLGQLRWIEGVEFLQKGLYLSDELRTELSQLPVS